MDWNKAMERWIAIEKKKQDKLVEDTIREYKLNELLEKGSKKNGTD